jgi:leader peptidase (prepilin peptidase) / N-methyltransferase
MIIFILLVLGLCLGSFVNALVARSYLSSLPESAQKRRKKQLQTSVLRGRSQCGKCGQELQVIDLVPIISFVLLRGKCRYCKKPIPDNPLPEIALPVVFIISYLMWPFAFGFDSIISYALFGLWLAIATLLMALFIYDLRWMILPDSYNKYLFVLASAFVLLRSAEQGAGVILLALVASVIVGGFFHLLFIVSDGRWIGGGDVKMGYGIGLLAGTPALAFLLIFLAALMGTVVALPGLVLKKQSLTSRLPFGPFLIIATTVVVLAGHAVLDWYVSLVLFV